MQTRRRRWLAALGVPIGLAVIGVGAVGLLSRHPTPAALPARGTHTVPTPTISTPAAGSASASAKSGADQTGTAGLPSSVRSSYASQAAASTSPPVLLTIPVIGVKARILDLGLSNGSAEFVKADLPAGALNTIPLNNDPMAAGWYTGSADPGNIGPAVIAGHINYNGPAVFGRLSQLLPGDKVYVKLADGAMPEFQVTQIQSTLKTDFPTNGVFGETADPELRLITCGGAYDPATHHYLSNTIVYAVEI